MTWKELIEQIENTLKSYIEQREKDIEIAKIQVQVAKKIKESQRNDYKENMPGM